MKFRSVQKGRWAAPADKELKLLREDLDPDNLFLKG